MLVRREYPENRTRRWIDGKECIFYDGYWVRYYTPPEESLAAKKQLIDTFTRRVFHHTELGINTPGERLEAARAAFEREQDPRRKRVCGAMLAGALFNRATDILTAVVGLAAKGVETNPDNELMRMCESCFVEALEFGKIVKHSSGCEGIDELWGEPLKAFSMTVASCYESRYVKIAQTMRDIDRITDTLVELFIGDEKFCEAEPLVRTFARAAKQLVETMRTDPVIFEVWPEFVACGEQLCDFYSTELISGKEHTQRRSEDGVRIIRQGRQLLIYLADARVPMPKSMHEFFDLCDDYRNFYCVSG